MDSLTQIVLGAACGEVVLGKKIGNKAMLFGAIGGTIPDLDVILGTLFYSNGIDRLAFHRGFMHSIVFAILASFVIGALVYKLYDTKRRRGTTTRNDWTWLFFWSIFTHPILDSFTPYGTQMLLPFSNHRIALNTISVVDPLYTLPFLVCLIATLFYNRSNVKRVWWTKMGIYMSSIYIVFTIGNKLYMDSVFEKSFQKAGVPFHRFSVQPTLLNNILWYGIAETEETYQVAFYSLFDRENRAEQLVVLPKNHDLLNMQAPDLKKLAWFSNGYYNLMPIHASKNIRYNDLRYPLLDPKNVNSSVFSFELEKKGTRWENRKYVDDMVREVTYLEVMQQLWRRMKGI
ncbi:metal-dependent hydrolase [Tenacibaculum maritimum]|uniref:Membrane-bound metal-dependent hydrolase n=1 Tax=Tenacibaculum maritimum NCIMB 2154 TaxID=1349785 RepID=A0A2H1ECR1_9FLAO|nr:metal-dependent hydrolase [Tenacibaculum maritimum]CAA0165948.1 Membrane-bound metal-dependent hydrolase [Tenacibaculum maritimum]CAA0174814.1 Membrane-bound metal-dependent hydrolase [Tenacibaculum maritimum]CAA0253397.1 Membrane-bound metal-dependent hydrolase [Tenacibaculum maritimum]SFZ84609.1 Membrane-bound metal-dependent hydrolase [Tenacibaculum maritimum NCIMB 2154]